MMRHWEGMIKCPGFRHSTAKEGQRQRFVVCHTLREGFYQDKKGRKGALRIPPPDIYPFEDISSSLLGRDADDCVHAQKVSQMAGKDASRLQSENMGKSDLLHPDEGRGVQEDGYKGYRYRLSRLLSITLSFLIM